MLKAKLLEDLIEKLHFAKSDLPSMGEKSMEEPKGEGVEIVIKSKKGPLEDEEDQGPAFETQPEGAPTNEVDMAEHDHEVGEVCGPECPVKLAIAKKMGKEI